jgi:hypothetical protein
MCLTALGKRKMNSIFHLPHLTPHAGQGADVPRIIMLIYSPEIKEIHVRSRLATGWKVRGSNPGGGKIFCTYPDPLRGPPSLLYNGYLVFPGVKVAGAWC